MINISGKIKQNKRWRGILDWCMALLLSLTLINVVCFGYVKDVAGVERSGGAVYAASQPGTVTINYEEGYGINKIDENGYTNSTSNLAEDGYILILGNSMTREVNVMPGDRYVQQLNSMVAQKCGGDASETAYVYSISRGGALFAELASGYDAALEEFPNAKAVIIQLVFSNKDHILTKDYIDQIYNQRFYDESQKVTFIMENEDKFSSMKHFVKNTFPIIPFVQNRRLNKIDKSFVGAFGIDKFTKKNGSNVQATDGGGHIDVVDVNEEYEHDLQALIDVLEYLNSKNDIPLIILDIPEIASFDEKAIEFNLYQQNDWEKACAEAGVTFLGMTDEFQQLYQNEKRLPYGFANTTMGKGHLNKKGNRVVAETLYRTLKDLEVIE